MENTRFLGHNFQLTREEAVSVMMQGDKADFTVRSVPFTVILPA